MYTTPTPTCMQKKDGHMGRGEPKRKFYKQLTPTQLWTSNNMVQNNNKTTKRTFNS